MDYTLKEKTQSKAVAEITNNSEEIDKAKKEAYNKLSRKVKIPGFRVGKAPYEIGAAYIGNERLLEESLDILMDRSIEDFLKKENIDIFSSPSVSVKELSNDKFVYEVSVEFLPEIDVDVDKKIEINKTIEVTDEEIEEKLKELQDTFTELEPKDGPVEKGDIVEFSYSINGKEEQTLTAEVGKDKVVEGFEDSIIGKTVNEEFEVTLTNSTVKFKILSIKTKKIPEINDDFAKEVGADSLEKLREQIKNQIYENKKLQLEENRGQEALEMLVDNLQVELPSHYIEEETEERYKEIEEEYLRRGVKLESLLEKEGKTVESFKNEIKEAIIHEMKEDLILRKIIEAKKITVSDEEVEDEYEHILLEQNIDPNRLPLTDDLRRHIENELLRDKAISVLKENTVMSFGGE